MNRRLIFILAVLIPALAKSATTEPAHLIDLSTFPPEKVWRTANSTITSAKNADGKTIWRWQIGAGEGFLWLNEDLPVHAQLQDFQRLNYEVNFADRQIELFWPRTMGVLKPPFDKMFCEWNLYYFSHPHKTWLPTQQILDDPSWFAHWASQIPPEIQLDRTHLLGFACLAKGPGCVVELRNVRLIRDCIRVEKPYLTNPIGWPVAETAEGNTRYRTPYFVKNLEDNPTQVSAKLTSQHKLFDIKIEPAEATIAAGHVQRFDVLATAAPDAPSFTEETAVVEFVPANDPARSYRTETFCTTPLPKQTHRMVALSLRDRVDASSLKHPDADSAFWMSVDLDNQTEIPHGIGHDLIVGLPITCPKCKEGHLHVTKNWLEVKCDHCNHTETHTRAADATWIGTWSEIHGAGPNPQSLGRAYLTLGDERYAQQAIKLLKLLASKYATLTWHNAADPDGGWNHAEPASPDAITNGASARWGNSPTYGTNFMVQRLASLHNMIVDSPSWTDADRKQVHEGLWIPVATELTKIVPGISNMNDIINRDLILAGLATNDPNMLYRGTLHPVGLLARMKDITPDGFSDEGAALNYHLAGMREWFPSIELLLNSKIDFPDLTDRTVAALKMPIIRAGLNGVTYCTGNSGGAWFQIPLNHEMFQLADKIFPPEVWPRDRHYETAPHLFKDAGWAVLRTGDTIESQVEVNVDYGRSHGHGDLDRLNLGLQAFGIPLSADPGSSYNYNTNAATGPAAATLDSPLAANTVIIDGKDQLRGAATLINWDSTPTEQRITAKTKGVHPGVSWQRSVALTNNITIIVDDLQSNEPHRYESAWHHYGKMTPADGCA